MNTQHMTGTYRFSLFLFAAVLLLLSLGSGRAGAGEGDAPAKRVIWADEPVIILPKEKS